MALYERVCKRHGCAVYPQLDTHGNVRYYCPQCNKNLTAKQTEVKQTR